MTGCIACKQPGGIERNGDECHAKAHTYLVGMLFFCDSCYASFLKTGYKRQDKPFLMQSAQGIERENRMSNQPFTDEFLTQVRETYQKSKPVLDELMPETAEVQKFFTAFRFMMEITPPQPGVDPRMLLGWLARLDGVLTKSSSVMTMLSGVAQSVNGVMSEHEEVGK